MDVPSERKTSTELLPPPAKDSPAAERSTKIQNPTVVIRHTLVALKGLLVDVGSQATEVLAL